MMAQTRLASTGDTATPILPSMPRGKPWLREISVHVRPPSVDLNSPEPGPPEDMPHGLRHASQSAA
jgi:hypothetical protein